MVSWAGLQIHSVWKWDPQGKGWAGKQEVPSGQLLRMEVGEVPGPPGEAGTCRKLPKVWCNQGWSEKKERLEMPDPCASQATWSKEQEPVLCWTQTLCFCWELPVVISTLVLFGWLVSFCLFVCFLCFFLSVCFWHMVLFLTGKVLICPG